MPKVILKREATLEELRGLAAVLSASCGGHTGDVDTRDRRMGRGRERRAQEEAQTDADGGF